VPASVLEPVFMGARYSFARDLRPPAVGRWSRLGLWGDEGGLGLDREDQGRPRGLVEVEVGEQAAEGRLVLAHVGTRVRSPVRRRVKPLAAEEVIFDEFQVGVEAERLVVDVSGFGVWADHQAGDADAIPEAVDSGARKRVVAVWIAVLTAVMALVATTVPVAAMAAPVAAQAKPAPLTPTGLFTALAQGAAKQVGGQFAGWALGAIGLGGSDTADLSKIRRY
jgi:hypothetical protein